MKTNWKSFAWHTVLSAIGIGGGAFLTALGNGIEVRKAAATGATVALATVVTTAKSFLAIPHTEEEQPPQ